MVFPSPRADTFYVSMVKARDWIHEGFIDTTNFWTRGYDRDTEWRKAFEDGKDRPKRIWQRIYRMALNTEERQQVTYFTGKEVEQTPNFGMDTLFVVGVQPVDEIAKRADERNITHIYLGTSQSSSQKCW